MPNRAKGAANWFVDRPWVIIGAVLAVIIAFWVKGTRDEPHHVRVAFDDAPAMYSGLDVRVDGIDAGKVGKTTISDGKAIVTLGIKDKQIWPLHQGTKATVRYGSTIGNGTRIIDITPGPKNAPTIPDNGVISNNDSVEATEFDDLFDTFNNKTRKNLQVMLKHTGDTFGPRPKQIGAAVDETAGGLTSVGGLAQDLSADEPALNQVVADGDRVLSTLGQRDQNISSLIGVAAQTFRTFAANTQGITGSLDRFPTTVQETRGTLRDVDDSVDHLDGLVSALKPGARQLGLLSKDLRPALADLRKTIPTAVTTFHTARKTAPNITTLLKEAQPFSDKAAPALTSLAPMFNCIRPYAPELGALTTQWSSWNQLYDSLGHVGRLEPEASTASLTSSPDINTKTYTQISGQSYALVRPPGYNVGQPTYMPECGYTADALDPAKDPEMNK